MKLVLKDIDVKSVLTKSNLPGRLWCLKSGEKDLEKVKIKKPNPLFIQKRDVDNCITVYYTVFVNT